VKARFLRPRSSGVHDIEPPLDPSGALSRGFASLTLRKKLGSRALRADAIEAITCGWPSFVAVVSLTAQALFGFSWIDSVGSLAIVWLRIKEGREAWTGDCCAACA